MQVLETVSTVTTIVTAIVAIAGFIVRKVISGKYRPRSTVVGAWERAEVASRIELSDPVGLEGVIGVKEAILLNAIKVEAKEEFRPRRALGYLVIVFASANATFPVMLVLLEGDWTLIWATIFSALVIGVVAMTEIKDYFRYQDRCVLIDDIAKEDVIDLTVDPVGAVLRREKLRNRSFIIVNRVEDYSLGRLLNKSKDLNRRELKVIRGHLGLLKRVAILRIREKRLEARLRETRDGEPGESSDSVATQ